MIRLIASDMDGTLLNRKHVISDENLEAIKYAQSKGVIFAIATGRDYFMVKPVLEQYNLKCQCIVMNGAEYRDIDGEVIESIAINKEYIKNIIKTFHEVNLSAEILTSDGFYVSNKEVFSKAFKERRKFFTKDMSVEEIKEMEKQLQHVVKPKTFENIDSFLSSDIEVYKIITFDMNEKIISEIKSKLREIKGLSVESTFLTDIEITDSAATKGKILSKVIKEMGLERDEVMVLGDSFNDYSMFKEFKNSFAMENAIPEVKEIATYITDTNEKSGVAKAIYKMLK